MPRLPHQTRLPLQPTPSHPPSQPKKKNWRKFNPTTRATDALLGAFAAACAAQNVVIAASTNAAGEIEIASAALGAGAADGVNVWDVVGAVAPRIFGECTSVAAAKGGHAKGTEPAVLLRHTTSGSFLVASRSKTNLRGFVCQKGRPNGLNASSWEACRIDTKFAKTFETPAKGFVEGTTVKYDGQLYEVAGYTTNGWRTH
jgi:hypothetical protein